MIRVGDPPYLECSSKGDKRFSAFYARIKARGNKSIEELYQAFKVFDGKSGLSWREAKGKKADNATEAALFYSKLWDEYFKENPELYEVIEQYNGFSDVFGQKGHVCQAIEIMKIKEGMKWR